MFVFIGAILQLGVNRMVQVLLFLWAWLQAEAGVVSAGGGFWDGAHPSSVQLCGDSPAHRQRGLHHGHLCRVGDQPLGSGKVTVFVHFSSLLLIEFC